MKLTRKKYALIIHGGAGAIEKAKMTPEKEKAYKEVMKKALEAGEKILKNKGSAVEAVSAAIVIMEDSPLFNAGKGSVFTHDGKNEMDASIMDGKSLNAGAVAGVSKIKNPIKCALQVMEYSDFVMLSGKGAEAFAQLQNCEMVDENYFFDENRYKQLKLAQEKETMVLDHSGESKAAEQDDRKLGTVGAAALDQDGNLAAGTSTGGMTNKRFGRIGDSPIIGSGTYANNKTCAISCTGHGEYFIKNVVAYDVSALMEYGQHSLNEASEYVVYDKLKKQNGAGGLIAVDHLGNFSMPFNTKGMYHGFVSDTDEMYTAIFE